MRQLQKEVIELNWKKNTVHTTGGSVASMSYIHDYELDEDGRDTKVYVLEGDLSIKNSMPASKASGIFAISRSKREIEIENNCSTCSSARKSDEVYCLPSSNQGNLPLKESKEESLEKLGPAVALTSAGDDKSVEDLNDSNTDDVMMTTDAVTSSPEQVVPCITRSDLTTALITNIVDEAISMSIGMDADSPVDRLQICRAGINNIINTNNASMPVIVEVFEFLFLLINNALSMGAKDTKYRSIKKSNGKFNRLVTRVNGGMNVLRSVGFTNETQETISLDRYDAALLYLVNSLLEACHLCLSKYRDYRVE